MVPPKFMLDRLADRQERPLIEVARDCSTIDHARAEKALEFLQIAAGIPVGKLRREDRLVTLLRPPKTRNPLKSLLWEQSFVSSVDTIFEVVQAVGGKILSHRDDITLEEYVRWFTPPE